MKTATTMAASLLNRRGDHNVGYLYSYGFRTGVVFAIYHAQITQFLEQFPDANLDIDGSDITLNGGERDQLLVFLKLFGGKWSKQADEYHKDKIQYMQEIPIPFLESYLIVIVAKEQAPPPSCQIIEVEELVPASVRKIRKLKCPTPQEAATDDEAGLVVEPPPQAPTETEQPIAPPPVEQPAIAETIAAEHSF